MTFAVPPPRVTYYPGLTPYLHTYQAMREFTERRTEQDTDQLWIMEHEPVYTLGFAGKIEHLLAPTAIPVYQVDRGGQITYHGPGQLIVYTLINLKRRRWYPRQLVTALEQAVIDFAADFNIQAERRQNAPGVYVGNGKLAALGLRIRRGCSYHGLSLNVNLDLNPFQTINPCGYAGLTVTSLENLGVSQTVAEISPLFLACLLKTLDR